MGVDTSKWTVQDYLSNAPSVGLSPANFVPAQWRSICQDVANNSTPQKAPATFPVVCNASLIIRGILYFKSNPGDCGSPTSLDLENASLTGLAGNAASAGLSIAKGIAGVGSGIASMAGAVLPGISVAVSAIQQIFANHAAAVANEQTTICKVAGVMNQVFPYYDNLVRTGKISPSTAYSGIQSFIAQVDEALSAIMKSCDAACVYTAILQAHSTFVEKYYPLIAPVTAAPHAPGAPPASTNTTPGGVVHSGNPAPVASPVVPAAQPAAEVSTDYYGNSVVLGTPFFSSALGTTILPGSAGDYFPPAILSGLPNQNPPAGNTWGLLPTSKISNAQYAQLVYQGAPALTGKGKGKFPIIYPTYGDQSTGVQYILYNGKLYPVNILSNSSITPGYQFAAGKLPAGYNPGYMHWVANTSLLPYPISNTPPSGSDLMFIVIVLAIVAAIYFATRKGTAASV